MVTNYTTRDIIKKQKETQKACEGLLVKHHEIEEKKENGKR